MGGGGGETGATAGAAGASGAATGRGEGTAAAPSSASHVRLLLRH